MLTVMHRSTVSSASGRTHNKTLTPLRIKIVDIKVRRLSLKMPCHFCPILSKLTTGRHILVKIPNIEFHENRSSGRQVTCGRAGGQTDTTKLRVSRRNCFANAPKITLTKVA